MIKHTLGADEWAAVLQHLEGTYEDRSLIGKIENAIRGKDDVDSVTIYLSQRDTDEVESALNGLGIT